jgi:predicted acyl esterase
MQITGGVETLTITGAEPGAHLRIEDAHGTYVATVVADRLGNAHLAFTPAVPRLLETMDDLVSALADGQPVPPGDYTVVDESATPPVAHGPVRVLDVDDLPDPSLYDQELAEGFGYLTVRDGVQLSAMVRFPDPGLYGPPPYPTVIEYSGYSPSDPDEPQPSTLLATLMGFAVVGVNMRGSGCSGGVFDVFSPAQAADGFDIVETVARQPWVLHGRPGMVGLSYPGISQLYVAATRPPHLAAIAPMSVIDDLWRQQWPGGIYNSGFTRAWLAARDQQTKVGGQAWDLRRIEAGDEVARENQRIRTQNLDFELFGRSMSFFGPMVEDRRVGGMIGRIEVPVYLTGAWQDEQTGSRFALMLDGFTSAPSLRCNLFNGHHPDGYSPMVVMRWYEFLSFHVARRIPKVPDLIRAFAPAQFESVFGVPSALEPDRFTHHDNFEAALADYLAEPPIRVLFESGAGSEVPGGAGHRYEAEVDQFPPADVVSRRWWLDAEGGLVEHPPEQSGVDEYLDDVHAGAQAYSSETLDDLNRFTQPVVPINWTRFDDDHCCVYQSVPLSEPLVVAGAGHLDLWLLPGTEDTAVQVTLTEVRRDGTETRVQCGWHRPAHRREDPGRSDDVRVDHTYTRADHRLLDVGEWVHCRVALYPVAHLFRANSSLRVSLSTPGRDHPFWSFEPPVVDGAAHGVGRGGSHASSLVLPVWPVVLDHPDDHPEPDAHRGQPSRPAAPIVNRWRAG